MALALKHALAKHPLLWRTAKRSLVLSRSPFVLVKRWRQAAEVRAYLASCADPQVILGAGPNHRPGWLCTDIRPRNWRITYLDAGRRFPFANASIARYHTEHMIEHIGFYAATDMVGEMRRTLRPGGRIRIATPSLDKVCGLKSDDPEAARYVRRVNEAWSAVLEAQFNGSMPIVPSGGGAAFAINRAFYGWGHRFVFDQETLHDLLERVGFTAIRFFPVGESDDDALRGLESHGDLIGTETNAYETMVVEATVPA